MQPRSRQILDAAAEAFHEQGFHGVGMDELGRRAGLSGSALYRHFAGKDEILAGLLDEALDELAVAASVQLADPHADLVRALEHHLRYTVTHRNLVSVYQRESRSLAEPYRRSFDRRRRRYVVRWEVLVARRFPRSAPDQVAVLTQALLGSVFSMTSWPTRRVGDADGVATMLTLVTNGILGFDPSGQD